MTEHARTSLHDLVIRTFATDVNCHTLGVLVLLHRDDDIALFVSLVNIPVSLDHLLQWIASINNGFDLPRFNEIVEVDEIFSLWDCCPTYECLTASH